MPGGPPRVGCIRHSWLDFSYSAFGVPVPTRESTVVAHLRRYLRKMFEPVADQVADRVAERLAPEYESWAATFEVLSDPELLRDL